LSNGTKTNILRVVPFVAFSEKLNYLFMLPNFSISCKPSIPWKVVQLYSVCCHGNQLCSHPWGASSILKLECILHLFMLQIQKPPLLQNVGVVH
jgi:hypothetical protein